MLMCVKCRLREHHPHIEQCSDDPRHQLATLDREILHLEAQLAQLAQRRVPIKRKINQYFSPILSLPVELSSEIFAACFPSTWITEGTSSPLILGQVCKAWRNLAWAMPCLWNTIYLSSTRPTQTHAQLLEEWIIRSANLPLFIHLKIRAKSIDLVLREFTHIMDTLARYSKRWQVINFDVPIFFSPDTSSLIPGSFPLLTSAVIQVDHVNIPFNMFLSAPHLKDVQLLGFPRNSFDLRWDLITRLRLNPTTVQQCLELLGAAPNLTHCVFENITRSDVVNPTPTLAPNLQSLEVVSFTHTPVSELLDTLLVPNVVNLSFHVTGNTFPYWSFISLITRSSCVLQHLTLNAVRIHEWQLWDCLRVTPSLLSLHLIDLDRVSNDTIRILNPQSHTLTESPHQQYIVPMLNEFVYMGSLEVNFLVIANMVYSRWHGICSEGKPLSTDKVARLQSFTFSTSRLAILDADDEFQLGYMRQLASEGMKISLITRERAWI